MIPGLLAAIAVFSYLLGGLNGAIIASKYVFHRDVRDYGSGNAGLTNFFRTFGAPGLAIVIGTDVLKTVIAVVAGGLIMGTQGAASTGQVFAGFCVMLGHIYPVFYGFRGGKGVLCAETMLLIVSFPTGLASLLIFVGIVWATRYVSLGSICGALIAPIGVLAACGKLPALLSLFASFCSWSSTAATSAASSGTKSPNCLLRKTCQINLTTKIFETKRRGNETYA